MTTTKTIKRITVLLTLILTFHLNSSAQISNVSEVSLGQVPVYTFNSEKVKFNEFSSYYQKCVDVYRTCAVGKESTAELLAVKMGVETYYKIKTGGNTYAVTKNPGGVDISDYYKIYIIKNGKYIEYNPTHKAGSYYLSINF